MWRTNFSNYQTMYPIPFSDKSYLKLEPIVDDLMNRYPKESFNDKDLETDINIW